MNLTAMPSLRLLFPFAIGIGIGGAFDHSISSIEKYGVAGMGAVLYYLAFHKYEFRHRWVFGAGFSLFLVFFGYAYTNGYNELRQPGHFSFSTPSATDFVGTVYDAPSRGNRLKVPLRVEVVGTNADACTPAIGNVILFLERNPETEQLRYGDRIQVHATIQPTEPPKNPYAFDYQRYLHFQNIHHQAFVQADSFVILSRGHGYSIWRQAFYCRDKLLSILQEHFPNQDEYAVASALLVGYKDDLSEDLRTAYAETGSMHALAVSGTHVSMLYAAIMFLLLRLPLYGRKGRLIEILIALALIWGFTFITGATASVLRASVMFTIFLVGKAAFKNASIWNTLGTSAFLLFIYNPYLLFDAGFQLSYAAVAGMVYFYPLFYKHSPILPKYLDEPWKVLLVGFAAQLGTLPLSLYYFHQFPVYFWLAGWIVVFGGAVFMAGGALLVLFDLLCPFLAKWLGVGLYYMLWGMNQVIFKIQHLPGSVVSGIWLAGWGATLLYVAIILIGSGFEQKRHKQLLTGLSVLVVLLLARELRAMHQHDQRQMTVYCVNKGRLIDFFDGTSLFSLSDTLTKKQVMFAAQSNRWAAGVLEQTNWFFGSGAPLVSGNGNFSYQPPLAQFFNYRIAIIDQAKWVQENPENMQIPVDLLIISKNPKLSIAECQKSFPTKYIIFDNTNSRRKVEAWKAECLSMGILFHDVREQGAWVLHE